MSTRYDCSVPDLSEKTPELHKHLAKILYCLEDYEYAVSQSEIDSSFALLAQLYPLLPDEPSELYSLLCTMGEALKNAKSAMQSLNDFIERRQVELRAGARADSARNADKKPVALSIEIGAGRELKQDFLIFAHSWFKEISFSLKPYWTSEVVNIINTHHHPASEHLGYQRTHKQLIDNICKINIITGKVTG